MQRWMCWFITVYVYASHSASFAVCIYHGFTKNSSTYLPTHTLLCKGRGCLSLCISATHTYSNLEMTLNSKRCIIWQHVGVCKLGRSRIHRVCLDSSEKKRGGEKTGNKISKVVRSIHNIHHQCFIYVYSSFIFFLGHTSNVFAFFVCLCFIRLNGVINTNDHYHCVIIKY